MPPRKVVSVCKLKNFGTVLMESRLDAEKKQRRLHWLIKAEMTKWSLQSNLLKSSK